MLTSFSKRKHITAIWACILSHIFRLKQTFLVFPKQSQYISNVGTPHINLLNLCEANYCFYEVCVVTVPHVFLSSALYDYCIKEGYADKNLIAKWKKQGYENLCCLRCIQQRDTNFGTNCICRVPKPKLEEVSSFIALLCSGHLPMK